MTTLHFDTPDGPIMIEPERCVVAGWTGRDGAAVRHHIDELAAIGVAPPSRTPLPYEVAPSLLTQDEAIHCVGAETSGEVEPALILVGGRRWVTLASDHTDRALEAHSVALSKQACAKPIARRAWPLDMIPDTDALILRSWIREVGSGETGGENGEWVPYQEGTLAAMLPLDAIVAASGLRDGEDEAILLCGTLPARGGVRPASAMRLHLVHPTWDSTIELAYRTHALPIVE